MNDIIIKVTNISKSFKVGSQEVPVLKDISFEVRENEFLIIFGPSGCGKSTLLHLVLGLEEPTSGKVTFFDKEIWQKTTEDERSEFRKKNIGMVYQQPNWIKSLTVIENVAFPLLLLGIDKIKAGEKAAEMLKAVQMGNWSGYIPTELSSGQQQRVALARAMVTEPKVIIADEPTGNLDYESGQELMKLLEKLNREQEKTIIMVTHDLEYLDFAKTAIRMFDGEIAGTYRENEKEKLVGEMKSKRGNGVKQ